MTIDAVPRYSYHTFYRTTDHAPSRNDSMGMQFRGGPEWSCHKAKTYCPSVGNQFIILFKRDPDRPFIRTNRTIGEQM